jgi:hypothetical protein
MYLSKQDPWYQHQIHQHQVEVHYNESSIKIYINITGNTPGRIIIQISNIAATFFTIGSLFTLGCSNSTINYMPNIYILIWYFIPENIFRFILFFTIFRYFTNNTTDDFSNALTIDKLRHHSPNISISFGNFHMHGFLSQNLLLLLPLFIPDL